MAVNPEEYVPKSLLEEFSELPWWEDERVWVDPENALGWLIKFFGLEPIRDMPKNSLLCLALIAADTVCVGRWTAWIPRRKFKESLALHNNTVAKALDWLEEENYIASYYVCRACFFKRGQETKSVDLDDMHLIARELLPRGWSNRYRPYREVLRWSPAEKTCQTCGSSLRAPKAVLRVFRLELAFSPHKETDARSYLHACKYFESSLEASLQFLSSYPNICTSINLYDDTFQIKYIEHTLDNLYKSYMGYDDSNSLANDSGEMVEKEETDELWAEIEAIEPAWVTIQRKRSLVADPASGFRDQKAQEIIGRELAELLWDEESFERRKKTYLKAAGHLLTNCRCDLDGILSVINNFKRTFIPFTNNPYCLIETLTREWKHLQELDEETRQTIQAIISRIAEELEKDYDDVGEKIYKRVYALLKRENLNGEELLFYLNEYFDSDTWQWVKENASYVSPRTIVDRMVDGLKKAKKQDSKIPEKKSKALAWLESLSPEEKEKLELELSQELEAL